MTSRNSLAIRRIHADMKELRTDASDQYSAEPREDDLFDWHFTLRGPAGTDFEGGLYHGRILLPREYPFKPPNIVFLTANGRFEVRTKICLSISAYHPESWQPAWGIRTILEALISFFPTKGEGAVGALDWSKEERQKLVPSSQIFCCNVCKKNNMELIPALKPKRKEDETATTNSSKKKKKKNTYKDQIAQMHMHAATGALAVGSNETAGSDGSDGSSGSGGSGGSGGVSQRSASAANEQTHQQPQATQSSAAAPTGLSTSTIRQRPQAAPPPITSRPHPTTTTAAAANGDSSALLYLAVILGFGVLFLMWRKFQRKFDF